MTNNSDTWEYLSVVIFASFANFWLSTGCSGEFHVIFENFEDLKNLILNILKKKLALSCLISSLVKQ